MKNAKASYKYGIEFLDFNSKGSRWLHNFDDLLPVNHFIHQQLNLVKIYLKKKLVQ